MMSKIKKSIIVSIILTPIVILVVSLMGLHERMQQTQERAIHLTNSIALLHEIAGDLQTKDNDLARAWTRTFEQANERHSKVLEDYNNHFLARLNAQTKLNVDAMAILDRELEDVEDHFDRSVADIYKNFADVYEELGGVEDYFDRSLADVETRVTAVYEELGDVTDVFAGRFNELPSVLIPELAQELIPSVVQIEVFLGINKYTGEDIGWLGSGVFVAEDLILTAGHVLDIDEGLDYYHEYLDMEYLWKVGVIIQVTFSCGYDAEPIDYYMEDPEITDLGILKMAPGMPWPKPIPFGTAIVGETVIVIGSPYGFFPSVSSGIVSALDVEDSENFWGASNLFQTDAPTNPGNSGGPVINMDGEVVSILVGGIQYADGIGLCIPADICKLVIEKYRAMRALEALE